jgi:PQQ-dependent dehydrogenase (methanol/ethanol family)
MMGRKLRPRRDFRIVTGVIAALLIGAAQVRAQQAASEWPRYGGDGGNQRFSPLTQVTTANVHRLVLRQLFQTGTAKISGFQASPIVTGGRMYVSTPYNNVIAYDLATMRERWRYEAKLGSWISCCGPVNRGVAVAGGHVFIATLDARVIALDAATGDERWTVQDSDADSAYAFTSAPQVTGDLVIVGTAGAEYPTRGRLTAYDIRTGERRWRWFAVPSPEEGGWWGTWATKTASGEDLGRNIAREKADSARYADGWRIGGGAVWTTPAYDSTLGLLYFGTGNPVPEYDASVRPGDNLYTSSLVALDAATGKVRWYHQYSPHDRWDYDVPNPPVLATLGGRAIVTQATKSGWVFVFDAKTGTLIRRSAPIVPQEKLWDPPTRDSVLRAPGAVGGANWYPNAYSPALHRLFIPAMHEPMKDYTADETPERGRVYRLGGEALVPKLPVWSVLSAVDIATGRIAWSHKGQVTAAPAHGGALATAGGLVFLGEDAGWFRALDARTGKVLWEFYAGATINAPPIAFSVGGEEFIAVAAGGDFYSGGYGDGILIFGLPK